MKKSLALCLLLLGCHNTTPSNIDASISSANDSGCDNVCPIPQPEASITQLDAQTKSCPDDMVYVNPELPFKLPDNIDRTKFGEDDFAFDPSLLKGPFCIDTYEAPNKKDEWPISGINAMTADRYCKDKGKRLPTHQEWVAACLGKVPKLFEFGNEYHKGICNDNKIWKAPHWELMSNPVLWGKEVRRLYNADMSGYHEECFSDWGDGGKVWDMVANMAEWVSDEKYGYIVMGCSWVSCYRPEPPSCIYVNKNHSANNGNFPSYEFGVARCVKDFTER